MTEHDDGSLFLQAEEQAQRIAAELGKLAETINNYKAVADRLAESAKGLGALTAGQQAATAALEQLTSELRRLAVEETQRRLDDIFKSMNAVSGALGELRADVRSSANAMGQFTEHVDSRLGAIERGQQASAKQLEDGLRDQIRRAGRLTWVVLGMTIISALILARMYFGGAS